MTRTEKANIAKLVATMEEYIEKFKATADYNVDVTESLYVIGVYKGRYEAYQMLIDLMKEQGLYKEEE